MGKPLPSGATIAVVGAGIIGASAAFVLAERGYKVTLIDRAEPGRSGPSFGNAGHVVGSAIHPLAEPGIALDGLRMLANPDAPLKIPAAYLGRIAPWLWRFWRSSTGSAYQQSRTALTALNAGAVDETEALFARAGMSEKLKRAPALYLYESEASWRTSLSGWADRDRAGLVSTQVDAAEIRRLEPDLAPIFIHGMLSQEWAIVTDPFEIVTRLVAAAQRLGVALERGRVSAIQPTGERVSLGIDSATRTYDAVLVTAGVWSRDLAKTLEEYLPVEAERGYNVTYSSAPVGIQRPLVLADRGVVATALSPGLRIGGWTELGGINLPPNPARWAKMRAISAAILPGIETAPAVEWMGHRPSMPDSVPVISRSLRHPAVFYAVGHGHYGLSYAAKTARLVGELIGDAADIRLAAHGMIRFNRP
ncbi:NAD(P)/FAD-dependent oxidoreductase [Devosia sp.]|uniref:NAD(P)/FAD-dependent oxidoreductase n=1 Tax=Devosia sp. TaxID=1871048 RepID=UPI003BA9DC9C